MKVNIILYGNLRENLPPETHGRMVVELPEGNNVSDLIMRLGIQPPILWAINGDVDRDLSRVIIEEDEIKFFRPTSGGSQF